MDRELVYFRKIFLGEFWGMVGNCGNLQADGGWNSFSVSFGKRKDNA